MEGMNCLFNYKKNKYNCGVKIRNDIISKNDFFRYLDQLIRLDKMDNGFYVIGRYL